MATEYDIAVDVAKADFHAARAAHGADHAETVAAKAAWFAAMQARREHPDAETIEARAVLARVEAAEAENMARAARLA